MRHVASRIPRRYYIPSTTALAGISIRIYDCLDKLCEQGQVESALEIMEERHIGIVRNNAYCLLSECCRTCHLIFGMRVQSLMVHKGLDSVAVLNDHLIRLFASSGCWIEANQAFTKVLKPSLYTWSAIILSHVDLGQALTALELYHRMRILGLEGDLYVFVAILKACTLVEVHGLGRLFHEQILASIVQPDDFVRNALLDMYVKCRGLEEARNIFDKLPNKDVVSWNTMIIEYAQSGEGPVSLQCFDAMQQEGIEPDIVTYLGILKACRTIGIIEQGRHTHEQIIKDGLQYDVSLGSTLVDMYAKCRSLEEAQRALNQLMDRNAVSWGAMIAGYAQHDECILALECFENMRLEGIKPDVVTLSSALKSCGSIGSIEKARCLHEQLVNEGLQTDACVGNTLVDMYARCGSLEEAQDAFTKLKSRDVVSWGTMIAGYAEHGYGLVALDYYDRMLIEGIKPNAMIFTSILNACNYAGLVDEGRQYFKSIKEFHETAIDLFHCNCMVGLLAQATFFKEAEDLLLHDSMQPNIIGWTVLLSACSSHNNVVLARKCFDEIICLDRCCAAAYVLMANLYTINSRKAVKYN